MITESNTKMNLGHGEWKPETPIILPPLFFWPPRPLFLLKYFFGYPGYLWPWNLGYMTLAIVTWFFLTPDISRMASFEAGWIATIYLRNFVLLVLVSGGLHFYLYILKAQDTRYKFNSQWQSVHHRRFIFQHQTWDNIFWSTVSGCSIWSTYEVLTLWAYANGLLPYADWHAHPVYFIFLFCAIPIIRDAHFYLVHRLLHYPLLYKTIHYLHHKNVNIGPWSGLSMHPIEHLLYFSGVIVHWIIMSHPLHAIFHLQQTGLAPALGHSGFDKLVLKGETSISLGQKYYHYLHHRYFECNYGGDGTVPLDKWFGTFHDGSNASHAIMRERRRQAHGTG